MKLFKFFSFLMVLSISLILVSCNEEVPLTPVTEADPFYDLAKFSLPESAVLESATFNIYVDGWQNRQIDIHYSNAEWEENETWNSFYSKPSPQYSTIIAGSFTPTSVDWYSVDVTSIVQGWVDGSITNNGILLNQPDIAPDAFTSNHSKENSSGRVPYLEIVYSLDGVTYNVTENAMADTYIWEFEPDNSYGSSSVLWIGNSPGAVKQILVKFDIEETPAGGGNNCTRLPIYWMKHSVYGPKPYDDTWALLGEDTPFFSSGRSHYQVLWTIPINPYYILGRVYVAAKLNFLNGADPSAVQDAFDDATILFNTYTPAQVRNLSFYNPVRRQFINLAIKLAKYNIGWIGPGHCGF